VQDGGDVPEAGLASDGGDQGIDPPLPTPTVECPEADGSPEVAVVVAINDGSENGDVAVFSLNEQGRLKDLGIRLGPIDIPQSLALRDDGQEALVGFGATARPSHGIKVVSLQSDGSGAGVVQTVDLGSGATPRSVTYLSDDLALVARIGGGADDLVPLHRQMDGTFQAGTPVPVPGEWPMWVRAIKNQPGRALVLRNDVLNSSEGSEVMGVQAVDGGIAFDTETFTFPEAKPSFIYMHPEGLRAYVPSPDPDAGPGDLNPPGILRVLGPGSGEAWIEELPFATPHLTSRAALSPSGDSMVFAEAVTAIYTSPIGMNLVQENRAWSFFTVALDGDGKPVSYDSDKIAFPAIFVDDIAVGPSGHVVVGLDTGVAVPGSERVIAVYGPGSTGDWVQVCDPIDMAGSMEIKIHAP
jgi:hypothetical protein